MTDLTKLEFIENVVKYREKGYMPQGSPADWFYSNYKLFNEHQFEGFPKYCYILKRDSLNNEGSPCMLTVFNNRPSYSCISIGSVIVDDFENGLDVKNLWYNGSKSDTLGNLKMVEIDESKYIDDMYTIAERYWDKDIIPRVRLEREIKENDKKRYQIIDDFFNLRGD